jgi:putative oxidoreductase
MSANKVATVLGRFLLSLIFIVSGVMKIPGWAQTSDYMASKGLPLVPVLLAATIAIEVLGGLSVLLGYRARAGALILALWLVPVTLIFHNFWGVSDPIQQRGEMVNFLKNLALIGSLLFMSSRGAGEPSLDARGAEPVTPAPRQKAA